VQAPCGLWDAPGLRRLGRGAALRTGSPSPMSLARSGLPDGPNDRSSEPPATYKHARPRAALRSTFGIESFVVTKDAVLVEGDAAIRGKIGGNAGMGDDAIMQCNDPWVLWFEPRHGTGEGGAQP